MMLAVINWHSVFFMFFATFACAFALGVLFAQNVVRMAFYLIISLASTAALFMLAGAEFVGAMQIMIYVGGTLVLLIFGVMLTAQANFVSMKTRAGEWILAAIFGGSLFVLLLQAAFSVPEWRTARVDLQEAESRMREAKQNLEEARRGEDAEAQVKARQELEAAKAELEEILPQADSKTATPIGLGLLGVRVDKLAESDATRKAGMSGYLLPFELVSVHLLVVLVGAAYLARTKRRVSVE
jgi:NADH-quinone oxidoreductase subunit J